MQGRKTDRSRISPSCRDVQLDDNDGVFVPERMTVLYGLEVGAVC